MNRENPAQEKRVFDGVLYKLWSLLIDALISSIKVLAALMWAEADRRVTSIG